MNEQENKILLSWTTLEFIYHAKNRTWLISFGIIAVGLFIAAVLIKNYFFALLVPIASFLIYVHAQKRPRQITVNITAENINIPNILSIPYKEIISFWIFEESEINGLSLETKKLLQTKIFIPLGDQEPATLRHLLLTFIKEKKQEDSLIDIIARRLKF